MRVANNRKICQVGQCLLPSLRRQFPYQYVPPQDLSYLKINQMRRMQRLAAFEKSPLNIKRGSCSQEQLKDRRSVCNNHRLSRSSRIIWAGGTVGRTRVRARSRRRSSSMVGRSA